MLPSIFKLLINLSLPKKTDLTQIFTKVRLPGRLKMQIWVEEPSSGSPGYTRKNDYYRSLK